MPPSAKHNIRFDPYLTGLLGLVMLLNIPLISHTIMPMLDTGYAFRIFYYYYNEAFFHGEIPQWMQFSAYGTQSAPYFFNFSPPLFLTGLTGLVLRVQDTYLLYTLGLMLEQVVFLVGMHLLSRLLFSRRTTAFFVCASALCGAILTEQVMLNFRIYYLVPLLFYFIFRFFRERRTVFLLYCSVVFPFFFSGMPGYTIPVPLLACSVLFVALAAFELRPVRDFLRFSRKDAIVSAALLLAAIAMLVAYYYYFTNLMRNTALVSSGRDPKDYTVPLESFLDYGGHTGPEKFLQFVYPNQLIITDLYTLESTLFVGILPLLLAGYALVRARGAALWGLSAVALIFALFSVGGATPVAGILYDFFPLMKTYRHIGFVSCYLNLLIPLIAGFGLDRLTLAAEKDMALQQKLAYLTAAATVIIVAYDLYVFRRIFFSTWGEYPYSPAYVAAFIFVALTVLWAARSWVSGRSKSFVTAAIVCILIETCLYHGAADLYHTRWTLAALDKAYNGAGYSQEAVIVNEAGYQETRTLEPAGERYKAAFKMFGSMGSTFLSDYNFLQYDACIPRFRMDVVSSSVFDLFETKYSNWNPEQMDDLKKIIGCEYPKLRIIREARMARSIDEADSLIAASPNLGDVPVLVSVTGAESGLEKGDETYAPKGDGGALGITASGDADSPIRGMQSVGMRPQPATKDSVRVTSYSSDGISVDAFVDSADGAWLYYADSWNPHWKAKVNGNQAGILIANKAFKAVRLAAGQNRVEFYFSYPGTVMRQTLILVAGTLFALSMLFVAVREMFFSKEAGTQG